MSTESLPTETSADPAGSGAPDTSADAPSSSGAADSTSASGGAPGSADPTATLDAPDTPDGAAGTPTPSEAGAVVDDLREALPPEATAEQSAHFDSMMEYLGGLSPEEQALALADRQALFARFGIDVSSSATFSLVIERSQCYQRESHHWSGDDHGGGHWSGGDHWSGGYSSGGWSGGHGGGYGGGEHWGGGWSGGDHRGSDHWGGHGHHDERWEHENCDRIFAHHCNETFRETILVRIEMDYSRARPILEAAKESMMSQFWGPEFEELDEESVRKVENLLLKHSELGRCFST